ncbi:MAG: ATP-dependent DNA helicase, partial [Prevotella sp.]|nr:ATP-dependent DNA helicase [Prevotella sp.]
SEEFEKRLKVAKLRLKPVTKAEIDELTAPPVSEDVGISVGNVIEHQRFGIGTVIQLEGRGENLKATVQFTNSGTKQLLLKFARYKIVK